MLFDWLVNLSISKLLYEINAVDKIFYTISYQNMVTIEEKSYTENLVKLVCWCHWVMQSFKFNYTFYCTTFSTEKVNTDLLRIRKQTLPHIF